MRILFLSNLYPPHHLGGYEEVCAEVAQRLRGRGHEVAVLTSTVGAARGGASDPTVRRLLHPEVDPRRGRGTLGFFVGRRRRLRANLRTLAATLREIGPQVVVVWGMWNLQRELPAELEKPGGPPLLYYVHDYWPLLPSASALHWQEPSARRWTSAAKRLLAVPARRMMRSDPPLPELRFDTLLCVSEAVRARLEREGLPVGGAQVLPAGIDTGLFGAPRPLAAARRGDFTLAFLGRLKPEKGVETAIDALAELKRRGHAARLAIFGRGPCEEALRARAHARGVEDRVVFYGFRPRAEIPRVLREHDAIVVPSLWPEPWARVIQEAMAAGAAVIASRVGGNSQLVDDGRSGLLYEAGDAKGLSDQLERLVRDPDLGRRLGERAAQVAREHFDIAATVQRFEEILAAAVERGAARS